MSVHYPSFYNFIGNSYNSILLKDLDHLFIDFKNKNKQNYETFLAIEEETNNRLKSFLPFSNYFYERNLPYSRARPYSANAISTEDAFFWCWFELSDDFEKYAVEKDAIEKKVEILSNIIYNYSYYKKQYDTDIPNWKTYFHEVPRRNTKYMSKDYFKINRELIIKEQPEIAKAIVAFHINNRDQ